MECVQRIGTHSQKTEDSGGLEVIFTTPLDLDTSGDISKYDNDMTEGRFWAILFATCIALKFLELIGVPLWTDNEEINLEHDQPITLLDWAKGKSKLPNIKSGKHTKLRFGKWTIKIY